MRTQFLNAAVRMGSGSLGLLGTFGSEQLPDSLLGPSSSALNIAALNPAGSGRLPDLSPLNPAGSGRCALRLCTPLRAHFPAACLLEHRASASIT